MSEDIDIYMVQEGRWTGKRHYWRTSSTHFFDTYADAMAHCAMIEGLGMSIPMLRIIKITGKLVG